MPERASVGPGRSQEAGNSVYFFHVSGRTQVLSQCLMPSSGHVSKWRHELKQAFQYDILASQMATTVDAHRAFFCPLPPKVGRGSALFSCVRGMKIDTCAQNIAYSFRGQTEFLWEAYLLQCLPFPCWTLVPVCPPLSQAVDVFIKLFSNLQIDI